VSVLTTHNVDDGGWTALHCAAYNGRVECAKVCVEMGANVNAVRVTGTTPLHFASMYGYIEVVRVLLDAGAIVDMKDDAGRTPMCFALEYNCVDIVRLLIDRGGKVSNVKLTDYRPAIPDWVNTHTTSKSRCRTISIFVIGIHKYHRTNITRNNDINVLKLISKHIWSTRMDDVWSKASSGPLDSERTPFNNCVSF
jgi:ankyrin repeat protein